MSDRQQGYRVLARKYRPARLADLAGQDVLVRTLTNAFAADRLAHAWLLTGVRGTGPAAHRHTRRCSSRGTAAVIALSPAAPREKIGWGVSSRGEEVKR